MADFEAHTPAPLPGPADTAPPATMSPEAADQADPHFRADVLAGLSQPQPAVPARWLYDYAGSALFEEITQLPEYYPTRTEAALLDAICPELRRRVPPDSAVVEFGSGSSAKTPRLLRCIAPASYVPIDISGEFLREAAADLAAGFPDLAVHPVEADFTRRVTLPDAIAGQSILGFFPGSTIGNMVPETAVNLLRSMRATLGTGGLLLIGMDRVKDVDVLLPAYDDAAGVTARFNMNLLTRINRELGATIPVDAFHHEARWNDGHARVEMHLVADRDVAFEVAGRPFRIMAGTSIHTENSHKYTPRSARLLLLAGGWTPTADWSDKAGQYALFLARAEAERAAP